MENPTKFQEGEFKDLLNKIGVNEAFDKLDPSLKVPVESGALYLRRLDLIGKGIESSDLAELQGSEKAGELEREAFQKQVKAEHDEVGRAYHKNNGEWFDESIKELIEMANSDNEAGVLNDKVLYLPDHYIKRLDRAGEFYKKLASNLHEPERVQMDQYLDEKRPKELDEMRKVFNNELGDILSGIGKIHKDLKSK